MSRAAVRRPSSRLLVVVECPLVEVELREKLRCPANSPIRCEHAGDLVAARESLERREFDLAIVVTLGRDPAEILDALGSARARTRVVVVGESDRDVTRALDAGAELAFERTRFPSGILSHLLGIETDDDDAFVTKELPVSR